MTHDGTLLFWRILLWAAPIIGGAIALVTNYKINSIETADKREKEKIEATKSEEKEKRLNAIADSIAKEAKVAQYVDKPKQEKMKEEEKKGDTYNVTSNNQTGGITAGKVEIKVDKEEQVEDLNIPLHDNYVLQFDKGGLKFQCNPKVGKWTQPFIGVPFEEQATFKTFGNDDLMMTDEQEGDIFINQVRFFAASCGRVMNKAKPATRTF